MRERPKGGAPSPSEVCERQEHRPNSKKRQSASTRML